MTTSPTSPTSAGETDLTTLLATMQPVLHDEPYEFVTVPEASAADMDAAIAVVREAEGVTLVRAVRSPPDAGARSAWSSGDGVVAPDPMAWITLTVHSSLQAVGLTAAVARCLADAGIACNVIAAFHHDHLFVPYARRFDALAALAGCFREPPMAQSTP